MKNRFKLNVLREQVFVSTSIILQIFVYMKIQEYQFKLERVLFEQPNQRCTEHKRLAWVCARARIQSRVSSGARARAKWLLALEFVLLLEEPAEEREDAHGPASAAVHHNTARGPAVRTCAADRSRTRSATPEGSRRSSRERAILRALKRE